MNAADTLETLLAAVGVAVIRTDDRDRAEAMIEGILEGGFRAVEITATTPGCFDLIGALAERARRGRIALGIGTIRTLAQLEAAEMAGAGFVVSPHTDPLLVKRSKDLGLVCIPGAATASEVIMGRNAGADVVKLFPISTLGGPRFVRLLRGPLPDVPFWVSGDVAIDELDSYLEAGAQLIGLTSALTADLDDPRQGAKSRAMAALEAIARARDAKALLSFSQAGRTVAMGLKELRRLPGSEHRPLETIVPGRRGHVVHLRLLLRGAGIPAEAQLTLRSADGQTRHLPAKALYEGGYLQFAQDGQTLTRADGGPLRLFIVGGANQCDNLKSLVEISVTEAES